MSIKDLFNLYKIWRKVRKSNNMFSWKKILATFIGVVVATLGKTLGLTDEQIKLITELIIGFLIGQGIADFGKSRAIIEAKTK